MFGWEVGNRRPSAALEPVVVHTHRRAYRPFTLSGVFAV